MILHYDVIVVGGGHAGCEAAAAAARIGAKTCLVTMDMNKIAQMSCNPAVGGIAKGQIVREIDALGGQMGLVTDATAIQFRMLNRSKGPAVWSPRAQCDREKFIWKWRSVLDNTDNLDIWQDQVVELIVDEQEATTVLPHSDMQPGDARTTSHERHVAGVRTIWGAELRAKSVVITAGTFLNGLMHIGRKQVPGGRIAEPAALFLTESITRHGIRTDRMKTGTPVRIDRRSVDFSLMEEFSFCGPHRVLQQLPCWTCNTNAEVHKMLLSGLDDSPLYNGQIKSIGPRYCPSIETKLVTFPDRNQHPLFLEPEGTDTNEMYLNGFSSSMPMEVQIEALKLIPALRNVRVYRPGYAIEYDFFDPTQLFHSLESKVVDGLFLAGQVNGTTGYEEAAGQGLVAGINAALLCAGKSTFTLQRDEAYIGVLIDDLVTKGVDEPYRMFTSRAEYRILLRQDDADTRLTQRSYDLGLATRERYDWWQEKQQNIDRIIDFCKKTAVKPAQVNSLLEAAGTAPLHGSTRIADLVARPQVNFQNLKPLLPQLCAALDDSPNRNEEIAEGAEINLKYEGYISRERVFAEKMRRLENIKIKGKFNYKEINDLSTECRQKLERIQPDTLAQASRIPGVSPSDINVLLVLLRK